AVMVIAGSPGRGSRAASHSRKSGARGRAGLPLTRTRRIGPSSVVVPRMIFRPSLRVDTWVITVTGGRSSTPVGRGALAPGTAVGLAGRTPVLATPLNVARP